MSKKIRVGWDDLKPGDLIHVKGSTNTYRFKSRTDWYSMIKVEGDGVGVSATWKLGVEKEPVSVFLVVYEEDFAYATRPAPKRPRLEEPQQDGEYWLKVDYPKASYEHSPHSFVHNVAESNHPYRIHEETMTEEKTASFKYERCIIDLTEFSHKVSVEVRVYDTEETMRRAACIDSVESSIDSNDLDRPIGDAAFENGTAGITLMQSATIDTQTNVVKYGNSPMCVIYLSREHLLPHIVSHECVHAAMGLYNAEILGYRHKAKACKHMTVSNELVAYVQSELFRCVMEFLADAVKTTEEEQ